MVARTLLGMTPPPPERVIPLRAVAPILPPEVDPEAHPPRDPAPVPAPGGGSPRKPAAAASASAAPPAAAPAPAPEPTFDPSKPRPAPPAPAAEADEISTAPGSRRRPAGAEPVPIAP
jgi:hypothetical protein